MSFEITDILLEEIKVHIRNEDGKVLLELFEDVHHADVAEILDAVNWDEAVYLVPVSYTHLTLPTILLV